MGRTERGSVRNGSGPSGNSPRVHQRLLKGRRGHWGRVQQGQGESAQPGRPRVRGRCLGWEGPPAAGAEPEDLPLPAGWSRGASSFAGKYASHARKTRGRAWHHPHPAPGRPPSPAGTLSSSHIRAQAWAARGPPESQDTQRDFQETEGIGATTVAKQEGVVMASMGAASTGAARVTRRAHLQTEVCAASSVAARAPSALRPPLPQHQRDDGGPVGLAGCSRVCRPETGRGGEGRPMSWPRALPGRPAAPSLRLLLQSATH